VSGVGSKVTVVSWVVAGGLAAWAAARVVGADRARRTETAAVPLLSLTPQVAAAASAAALGLRLTRRRGPATTAALAATTLGLIVRSRGVPRRQPEAGGATLRVVTVNLYHGRAHAESVVARVRQAGADVLFVQELTADAVTRLKQAGLEDLMPHTQLELRLGRSRGSGIYSRFPLGEGPPEPPARAAHPTALVELPGGESVELICAHPAAPALARGGSIRWRSELAALPAPGERPRVIAGDFNATLDHAAFRAVLRLGYADAARQTGEALTRTWGPPGKRALLTIDHVLVSRGCAVLACSVHVIPGSDHRAVYAEIRLPRPVAGAQEDAA
jgi:endonuclease/exonuclease/phosphatase family metal-dependent hydrolase